MSENVEPGAVVSRTAPTIEAAFEVIDAGLERESLVAIFGRCSVEYDGRAESTLGPGDRHVTCKPDGTVLVHTDEGHQPVNWQPPGSTQTASIEDGALVLASHREDPAEELLVTFERIGHVGAFDVTDPEDLSLSGTEEDLRQRILDEPELVEADLTPLSTERQTAAGAVDIYAEDRNGRAVVVELKRRRVGPDAVGQLSRYVEALERDLHAEAGVRGILVAPSVTDRARNMLAERGLEFVSLEP